MGRIKDKILGFIQALPFGFQGAEREIVGASNTGEDGTVITQEVSDERVAKHLLKGEITQEVEELRYRTYKVSNESTNYNYIGNGVAEKTEKHNKTTASRTKFNVIQENRIICSSILNELKHVDSYGLDRYRVEITYNDIVRFKLEQFAHSINVSIDESKNKIETTLRFWKDINKYDVKHRPFINELKNAVSIDNEYLASRNEILSSIKTISFSTYRASGDDDFTLYAFENGCKFKEAKETDSEYMITYSWDSYTRIPLNLEEKYYSKEMDEKYANNAPKNPNIELVPVQKKYFCTVCGEEVDEYTAHIQMADGNPIICKKCMEKALRNSK